MWHHYLEDLRYWQNTEPHSSEVIPMELKSMYYMCCHCTTMRHVWQRRTRKTYKGSSENKGRIMEAIVLKIILISHRVKQLRKHRKSKHKALVPLNFLVFVFLWWQFIHNSCVCEWASVRVFTAVQFWLLAHKTAVAFTHPPSLPPADYLTKQQCCSILKDCLFTF